MSMLRMSVVRLDEALHPAPRVGGGVGEFLVFAVEEAVGRAGIDGGVVLDVALATGLVELIDVGLRNALVSAAEQREHRALVARHRVDGLGAVGPALETQWPAVEADHALVAEPARGLEIRQRAAE